MPVLGIDLGTSSVVTGAAQKRGVDIILNETANRRNPTCITFTTCERNVGELAQTTSASNMQNHITNIVRFIGRSYDAKDVQEELRSVSFRHKRLPNGEIGVVVTGYDGVQETVFTFTQLLAMVFHKIQEDVQAFLGFSVLDVVIAVPSWFTQIQKKEVRAAAEIVEFAVLAIIPTHLAATVTYGLRKLPELNRASKDEELKTIFLDIGESTTTASIGTYTAAKFQVTSFACDRHLGGRDFDAAVLDMIVSQSSIDLSVVNKRAYGRIMKAARQVKHVLSSNAEAPYSIECVTEDRDVHGRILRKDFEERIKGLYERVENVVKRCIENGKDDLTFSSLEIYGGSTRIPLIQQKISEYIMGLQKSTGVKNPISGISRIMNADECVAYGTTMYGAFLSKGFKTPDILIYDVPLYNVALVKSGVDGGQEETTLIYTTSTKIPSLMQTHYNINLNPESSESKSLKLQLRYANAQSNSFSDPSMSGENIFVHEPTIISDIDVDISKVHVGVDDEEFKKDENGEDIVSNNTVRIRVKVRCDKEGLYSISSISYEESYVDIIKEKVKKQKPVQDNASTTDGEAGAEEMKDETEKEEEKEKDNKEKEKKEKEKEEEEEFEIVQRKVLKKRRTLVPFKETQIGIKEDDVKFMREQELKMRLTDMRVKALKEARNDLETLIYTAKDSMSYKLASSIPNNVKENLTSEIEKTEAWLYSTESESAQVKDFEKYKNSINKIIEPYERIYNAHIALDEASNVISRLSDAEEMKLLDSDDAKYSHISKDDRNKVKAKANELRSTLESTLSGRYSFDMSKMPPVTIESIKKDVDAIIGEASKLMATPKPTPKPKQEKKKEEEQTGKGEDMDGDKDTEEPSEEAFIPNSNDAGKKEAPANDLD